MRHTRRSGAKAPVPRRMDSTSQRIRRRIREILADPDAPMPTQVELAAELHTEQTMVSYAVIGADFYDEYKVRSGMTNLLSCQIRVDAQKFIAAGTGLPETYVAWAKLYTQCDSATVRYAIKTMNDEKCRQAVEVGMKAAADKSINHQTMLISAHMIAEGVTLTVIGIAGRIWRDDPNWDADKEVRKARLKAIRTAMSRFTKSTKCLSKGP